MIINCKDFSIHLNGNWYKEFDIKIYWILMFFRMKNIEVSL